MTNNVARGFGIAFGVVGGFASLIEIFAGSYNSANALSDVTMPLTWQRTELHSPWFATCLWGTHCLRCSWWTSRLVLCTSPTTGSVTLPKASLYPKRLETYFVISLPEVGQSKSGSVRCVAGEWTYAA